MSVSVAEVLRRVSIVLNDEDYARWTQEELLLWLNDAASEVVVRRPAARSITRTIELVEGVLQRLPEGSIQLLDVVRNVPGRPISRASRRLLDDQAPDWYEMRPERTKAIKHYSLEEVTPVDFYVYPPAREGMKVEVKYSEAPPLVNSPSDTVELDRAYIGALVSYVLYRAMAKDSEYANGAVAITHFQAFNEALIVQNQVSTLETGKAGSA